MTNTFFFLDSGTQIKAVISSKVTKMIHNSKPYKNAPSFENFTIESNNRIFADYLLLGRTLVEEGATVGQGQTIAISSGGDLGFHYGNFILWLYHSEPVPWGQLPKTESLDLLK